MTDLDPKEAADKCNARKSSGSGYCQHRAGWGTDHVGHGRCRYHGGATMNHEKNIIDKLSEASDHAAQAYLLKLKHARQKIEDGRDEDIDWGELDRMARTAFDRSGHGPTEKREVETEIDGDITINFEDVDT